MQNSDCRDDQKKNDMFNCIIGSFDTSILNADMSTATLVGLFNPLQIPTLLIDKIGSSQRSNTVSPRDLPHWLC